MTLPSLPFFGYLPFSKEQLQEDNLYRLLAALALLITTFFWGVTFTIVKDAVSRVDVFVFLSQRFVVASILMLIPAAIQRRKVDRRTIRDGSIMGIFLFGSYAFQTVALQYTTASNTAFLTGLNVVMVPVLAACIFRQRIGTRLTCGVVVAVAGLYLLCTKDGLTLNGGDILAAICALCVSLHLLFTDRYSTRHDVWMLTTVQLGVVGILSLATAVGKGERVAVWHPELLSTLIVCILFATVFAFVVQTSMQRLLSPSHTALIFCTEPAFASLYAWWAIDEKLGLRGFAGAGLILGGMLLAQLQPGSGVAGSQDATAALAEGETT